MYKGQSVEGLKIPEVCPHLSATLSSPDVAYSSSRAFQRKTIGWANQGQENRASGSTMWIMHSGIQ